jgi:uncharacterized glyoxalase superfamily protein PhnB
MPPTPKRTTTTLISCLRYRDAPAAIDWLGRAFGFHPHLVVPGPEGTIAHARLTFGNGMIMLGSHRQTEFGDLTKQPDEVGGGNTQSVYVVAADADAVYASARAAGARIVREIRDEDYGGRGFGCVDPEGHLWYIGSYDPWAG